MRQQNALKAGLELNIECLNLYNVIVQDSTNLIRAINKSLQSLQSLAVERIDVYVVVDSHISTVAVVSVFDRDCGLHFGC